MIRGGLKSGSYKVDFVANSLAAQKRSVASRGGNSPETPGDFLMVGGLEDVL